MSIYEVGWLALVMIYLYVKIMIRSAPINIKQILQYFW